MIADGRLDGSRLHELVELQEDGGQAGRQRAEAVRRWRPATPRTRSATGWTTTASPAAGTSRRRWSRAASTSAWLEQVAAAVGPDDLEAAVRWLTYTVDTELLMGEIDDAVTRISGLVGAAKQYSQLDRAPHQVVDVHDLLDATLVMLNGEDPEPGSRWSRSTTATCRRSRRTRPS